MVFCKEFWVLIYILVKDSIIILLRLMILLKSLENFGNIFIFLCFFRTKWRISFKRIWVFWIIFLRIMIFLRFNWWLIGSLSIEENVFTVIVLIDSVDDFVKLMWRILFKIWDFFQGGRFWIEDNLLLIWLILIDGSEIKTWCRRNSFMWIKDHFFDKKFLLWRVEVSLLCFVGFRLHDFW